jgi:hypothetical protein
LSGAADEQLHWTATLTANVNFTLKDEDHSVGWLAFFKQDVAGLRYDFFAVLCKPEAIFKRESL